MHSSWVYGFTPARSARARISAGLTLGTPTKTDAARSISVSADGNGRRAVGVGGQDLFRESVGHREERSDGILHGRVLLTQATCQVQLARPREQCLPVSGGSGSR